MNHIENCMKQQLKLKKVFNRQVSATAGLKEAEAIYSLQTLPCLKAIQVHLAEMNDLSKKNLLSEDLMIKNAVKTRVGTILVSIAAIVVGICVGWLISRSISRPVKSAVSFAQAIAAGDLSQTLEVKSKDEVGELTSALNKMSDSLRDMIGKIRGTSEQVASAAGEISANSGS